MKIGVCGLGLGYCLSHYLTTFGYDVVGVDINPDTFTKPNPKVDEEMKKFIEDNFTHHYSSLKFTTKHNSFADRDYIIIFVATPIMNKRLSMKHVLAALKTCVEVNQKATYLIFSTLPVGGMAIIHAKFPNIRVFYTPPMVRQGHFLSTFRNPPGRLQAIGFKDQPPEDVILLYSRWLAEGVRIIPHSERVVELAKLLLNMMLSIKIVSANAVASWLKDENIAKEACKIVNLDPRIGVGYFTPGGRAAGPCFPRDLTELEEVSKGSDLQILLKTVNKLNKTEELL